MKNKRNTVMNGGEIIYGHETGRELECCDCGLVHFVVVKIRKKKAILKFFRDDYETQKGRKKNKIKLKRKS